jgi:signal transduction histidine kinase
VRLKFENPEVRPIRIVYDSSKQGGSTHMPLDEELTGSKHLEMIGRLSESVAHDVNNLLSGVLGYSELLLEETQADHLKPFIEEIMKAGKRIASLTRLLLVFRKSDYKPESLDLNEQITELQKYIPPVIGSGTTVATSLQPGLWPVEADPTHIKRMIFMITATVRDLMPEPGRLALETKNISVPGNVTDAVILDPGRYVRITVEASAQNPAAHFGSRRETVLGNPDLCETVRSCGGHLFGGEKPGNGFAAEIYLPAANTG